VYAGGDRRFLDEGMNGMLGALLGAIGATVWYALLTGVLIVLLVLAIRGNWFVRMNAFLAEVRAELKKVSWPSKDELRSATAVVIVSTALMTAFVVFVDFVLDKIIRLFF
jgi:preprotein translocase subunit SecE